MGKGTVTCLALGASTLAALVVAPSAAASPLADGPATPVPVGGPGAAGQTTTTTAGATAGVQAGGDILATVSLTTPERRVLTLINNARAARGLHRLRARASLTRAARAHSRSMLRLDYFSHSSVSGETYAQRILGYGYARAGCSSWSVGEVIGWGAGSTAGSARAVFRTWMSSSGHRAVILTRRWRDVGVGRALGTYAGIGDVRMFTVDLGRRIY